MRDIELVKRLQQIDKPFYTIEDLEKITGLERDSLYVTLNRLLKRGTLERIRRGIYLSSQSALRLERISSQLYFPAYLSFESALARYGILDLIPYALTFATTRKTKETVLLNRLVKYRQIKKELFFGFELQDGIYVAEPEKAFLDMLYMVCLGKASLAVGGLDLRPMPKEKLQSYLERYPPSVAKKLKELNQ